MGEQSLDTDVIVVGCGPVGVMAALRCAQRGLRVVAIDKATDVYPLPRALAMDGEVQDLFARAGLIEALRQHSTPLPGGEFVDVERTRVVGIDVPPGTVDVLGHPPMVSFDQPAVERFLRQAARTAGVDMRLSCEVVGLDQSDESVTIALADDSQLTSRWVIGADGASSTIRSLVGVDLIDQQFDQTWLVVDTTLLDPDLALPALPQQICDPARVMTFVLGHDTRRRWEFQLLPDETAEQAREPGFLASLLAPWGRPDQLQVDRSAVYRFHATVADHMAVDRVFLAGDAAHQMPPFNGQGMCCGMRDAENLSWKLAAVTHGRAGDRLLDTYDAERRPHATRQVEHSVDAGMLIEAIAHDGEAALESGYGRRKFPELQFGLTVGDHPLVGRPLPRPGGDSFAVGNGWTVLRGSGVDGDVPALWDRLGAMVHRLDRGAYGDLFDPDATVIVRPDRFVAAVTTDLAVTTAHFQTML